MPLMTSLKGMMRDRGMDERRKRTGLKSAGWPGSGLNDIVELIYSPFWSLSTHVFLTSRRRSHVQGFLFLPPFSPTFLWEDVPGIDASGGTAFPLWRWTNPWGRICGEGERRGGLHKEQRERDKKEERMGQRER